MKSIIALIVVAFLSQCADNSSAQTAQDEGAALGARVDVNAAAIQALEDRVAALESAPPPGPPDPGASHYVQDPPGFIAYADLPVCENPVVNGVHFDCDDPLVNPHTGQGAIVRLPPGDYNIRFHTSSGGYVDGARLIFEAADPANPPNILGGISFSPNYPSEPWPELGIEFHNVGLTLGAFAGQNTIHIGYVTRVVLINVDVENTYIDANQVTTGRNALFVAQGPAKVLVEGSNIHDAGGQGLYHGIYASGVREVKIRTSNFQDIRNEGHAIKLYVTDSILIEHNTIRHGPTLLGELPLLDLSSFTASIQINDNHLVSNTDRAQVINFTNRMHEEKSWTTWHQPWPDYATVDNTTDTNIRLRVIEDNTFDITGTEDYLVRNNGTNPRWSHSGTSYIGPPDMLDIVQTQEPSVVVLRNNTVNGAVQPGNEQSYGAEQESPPVIWLSPIRSE